LPEKSLKFLENPIDRWTHCKKHSHLKIKYFRVWHSGSYDLRNSIYRYQKVLEGYSDSKCISNDEEIKATSGYMFTLGGCTVSWKSYMHTILTRSTMEAELIALDTTTVEAEWLRELLMDLPVTENWY
jgi:hypothetical protein